jgi:hypothetical protein
MRIAAITFYLLTAAFFINNAGGPRTHAGASAWRNLGKILIQRPPDFA